MSLTKEVTADKIEVVATENGTSFKYVLLLVSLRMALSSLSLITVTLSTLETTGHQSLLTYKLSATQYLEHNNGYMDNRKP